MNTTPAGGKLISFKKIAKRKLRISRAVLPDQVRNLGTEELLLVTSFMLGEFSKEIKLRVAKLRKLRKLRGLQ